MAPKGIQRVQRSNPSFEVDHGQFAELQAAAASVVKKLGFQKLRDLQRGGHSSSELSSLSATFTFPTKAPKGLGLRVQKAERRTLHKML